MSTLQNQLAAQERDDVARAIRALLRTPWVSQASDPGLYEVIRHRQTALSVWFADRLGWTLTLQADVGFARLAKRPAQTVDAHDHRPARRPRSTNAPFDRMRYVLLCVVAAEAIDLGLVTIGVLADRVSDACSSDDTLPAFRSDRHDHRRAFVDVLLRLEQWAALTVIDGRTQGYADDASAAVLYRVNTAALHQLLSCSQSPSLALPDDADLSVEVALALLTDEPGYGPDHRAAATLDLATAADDEPEGARPSSVQRNRWARHSLLRRLFDDPAVHRDDLTAAELSYISSISGLKLVRDACDQAGFALEERAEGWLVVDPDRATGPDAFPAAGAASAAGLHLINALLSAGPAGADHTTLVSTLGELMVDTPAWARTYRNADGPERLTREALDLLAAHHMVSWSGDRVISRPAAARYREASLRRRPPQRKRAPEAEQFDLFGGAE